MTCLGKTNQLLLASQIEWLQLKAAEEALQTRKARTAKQTSKHTAQLYMIRRLVQRSQLAISAVPPMSPEYKSFPAIGAPTTCRYTGKKCLNLRALKRNGSLHNLYDRHRIRANLNQRQMAHLRPRELHWASVLKQMHRTRREYISRTQWRITQYCGRIIGMYIVVFRSF